MTTYKTLVESLPRRMQAVIDEIVYFIVMFNTLKSQKISGHIAGSTNSLLSNKVIALHCFDLAFVECVVQFKVLETSIKDGAKDA